MDESKSKRYQNEIWGLCLSSSKGLLLPNINNESFKSKQRRMLFPSLFFIIAISNVKLRLHGGSNLLSDMI